MPLQPLRRKSKNRVQKKVPRLKQAHPKGKKLLRQMYNLLNYLKKRTHLKSFMHTSIVKKKCKCTFSDQTFAQMLLI